MNDINEIVIEGNLTKDPEFKDVAGTSRVAKITIAVNRRTIKEGTWLNETWFFHVEAWDTLADNAAKYLKKGRAIRVNGHIKQDTWVDKFNVRHESVSIVAEHIEYGPKPKETPVPASPQEAGVLNSSEPQTQLDESDTQAEA